MCLHYLTEPDEACEQPCIENTVSNLTVAALYNTAIASQSTHPIQTLEMFYF